MRHRRHCPFAHDEALRERVSAVDAQGSGVDGVEQHGAGVGDHAEHRLDTVGPGAQIVDHIAREPRRLERRHVERNVRRRHDLPVGSRRRARRVPASSPVAAASSCAAILAHVSNVSGPSTRLSGMVPAASSACAARPSRPFGSTDASHRGAVGARQWRADELPDPRERQGGSSEVLRRDDEPRVATLATGSPFGGLSEIVSG